MKRKKGYEMKHRAEYYEKLAKQNNWTSYDVASAIHSWYGKALKNWEVWKWLADKGLTAYDFREIMK